jgi:sugar phosphate isomerase/epimerase
MSLSFRDDFTAGRMDLDRFIELAYELRLDGLDVHAGAFASTEPDYLRDVRMRALKRGLSLGYIGVSNDFGKPQEQLDNQVRMTERWIDVAAFMGVPLVRVFAAYVQGDDTRESVWNRMMPCLRQVVEYGRKKGIVVGLQNHNHRNITRTGRDVRRIIEEIDNPYLSHILDTGQYVGSKGASGATDLDSETELYESISETAPLALHVRCKFYRIGSGSERWLDYPKILQILDEVGFNGWLSVVYEGWASEPAETAVPKCVDYLRQLTAHRK